jgi:DNA-entry nuclease
MQEDDIGDVQEEFMDRTSVMDEMYEFESSEKQTSETEDEEQVMSYVINKNTGVFHYTDCSSVSKIKPTNRIDFEGTREELIDKYKPCGNCHP